MRPNRYAERMIKECGWWIAIYISVGAVDDVRRTVRSCCRWAWQINPDLKEGPALQQQAMSAVGMIGAERLTLLLNESDLDVQVLARSENGFISRAWVVNGEWQLTIAAGEWFGDGRHIGTVVDYEERRYLSAENRRKL